MNNLQIFSSPEFGQIRTLQLEGETWFVAKDVCGALDIKNPTQAVSRIDEDERAMLNIGRSENGGGGETNAVNEYGLYNLVLASRKPEAKAFKRWITHEVLPSIRKTGSYVNPRSFTREQMVNIVLNPDFLLALHDILSRYHALETARQVGVAIYKQLEAECKPAKEYLDKILASNDDMAVSQIAADYGLTAAELNEILKAEKVQHKVNGQWLLTKKYMNKGYTHSKTFCVNLADGGTKVSLSTCWTQKGRLFIHNLLKGLGYAPVSDGE